MIFGMLAIAFALAGTLVSTLAYLRWMIAERQAERKLTGVEAALKAAEASLSPIARWGFIFSFFMLLLAILQVETAAYRHDFTISYIQRFSSRDEPKDYLFATLWAGQEGTFLLWCTYVSILGLIARRFARSYEPSVMFFVNLIRLSLLTVLVGKSPFAPTPDLLPAFLAGASTFHQSFWTFFHSNGLDLTKIPLDGQGLNPLLQNAWMRIHPPTLFFGFASTSIPFAFTMAALWKKDYETWIRRSLPWAALSFTVLGTGIMMGGYWAYAVLGWGGFWGWDPVENSSKVPWLMCVLLLHGMVMQVRRNTWHRATALFGLLPFLMVMFSSFLTRSGILENFSVHSFAKEDDLFPYLVGPLIFFWVMGIGLWLSRWKSFPSRPHEPKAWTVPAYLTWAIPVIGVFGFLVWLGMSSPLLTGIAAGIRERVPSLTFLPGSTSNVSQSYYNYIAVPFSILAAWMMASIPFLSWRDTDVSRAREKALMPLSCAIFVLSIAIFFGVGRGRPPYELYRWHYHADQYRLVLPAMIPLLAVIFSGAMAFFSSITVLFQSPKKIGRLGGYLSHAGIGVLLIGVIASELTGGSQRVALVKGAPPQQVMGYWASYAGMTQPKTGKQALNLTFTRGNESFQAPAPMYWSNYNQQYMYAPYIHKFPGEDLYIAPEGPPMSTADAVKRQVEMKPGQASEFVNDVAIRFLRFEVSGRQGGTIRVGVDLEVIRGNRIEEILPYWEATPNRTRQSFPAKTKDGNFTVEIDNLDANKRSATLIVGGHDLGEPAGPPQEIVLLNVSTKPMINLVWLATLLVMCGGLLTVFRAFKDLKHAEAKERGRYLDGDSNGGLFPKSPEKEPSRETVPAASGKDLAGAHLAKRLNKARLP